IGSNNLKEISDSICKLTNLEELDILSSSIKKLPELKKLKKLKELILIDTKIKNKNIFDNNFFKSVKIIF
ncbi:leucine-rich repeat domain-containing protein, partial [Brachyspira pilosicoli]